MSDEQKRENWYSGAVGKLELPERRTRTASSVSDVKPIPAENSSQKSDNGSEAIFAEFDKDIERRMLEERRRSQGTQDKLDRM